MEVATDSDGFYDLVDLLRAEEVTLESVTTPDPDLEDVFLGLTNGTATSGDESTEGER